MTGQLDMETKIMVGRDLPWRGLNLSLPKSLDLYKGDLGTIHHCRLNEGCAYLKDIPYWATASYPDFQTNVTSQALVA